jgi:hypothetical protein
MATAFMKNMKIVTVRTLTCSALLLAFIFSPPALASMAVIDTTAVGKLTDQLSKMQQQIEMLTGINTTLQDQIDAIGKMGQITLPTLNAAKIGSRLRQDLQCLKPDFSKLMPNVNFEDLRWNSICQGSAAYKDTLFINPEDLVKLPSWEEQEKVLQTINDRRRRILEEATSNGLAHSDIATKDVEHLNKAADDLANSVSAATTQNDRLAAIAEGQVIMARAMGQQNQILATMLKVQSAFALQAGVRVDTDLVDKKKTDKGTGQ